MLLISQSDSKGHCICYEVRVRDDPVPASKRASRHNPHRVLRVFPISCNNLLCSALLRGLVYLVFIYALGCNVAVGTLSSSPDASYPSVLDSIVCSAVVVTACVQYVQSETCLVLCLIVERMRRQLRFFGVFLGGPIVWLPSFGCSVVAHRIRRVT